MNKQLAKLLQVQGRVIVKDWEHDGAPCIYAEPLIDADCRQIYLATEREGMFGITVEDLRALADWVDEIADALEAEEMKDE